MAAHLLTRATVGVGVALLSLVVPAAAQDKVWRLGLLSAGPQAQAPGTQSSWRSGVLASLERKGFRVGTNLELVDRYAGGNLSRMPSLAREIAAAKVDVDVAITDPAVKACWQPTRRRRSSWWLAPIPWNSAWSRAWHTPAAG